MGRRNQVRYHPGGKILNLCPWCEFRGGKRMVELHAKYSHNIDKPEYEKTPENICRICLRKVNLCKCCKP